MNGLLFKFAITALLVVSLSGCLKMADSSETHKKVGEIFELGLESNPTTGYQWQLAQPLNEDIVMLINSEYFPPEGELVGAGGKEIWTFETVGPGTVEISFKYIRPWEVDVPVEKEQSFVIIVE